MKLFKLLLLITINFLPNALNAASSALPDAGTLGRQMNQDSSINTLPELHYTEDEKVPSEEKGAGVKVSVKSFRFEGNTIISSTMLLSLLQKYLNKDLTFSELKEAAIIVANAYRADGWIVRAYLPEQNIVDGEVLIRIIESKFGCINFDDAKLSRISEKYAKQIIETQQEPGTILNHHKIDRALLLLGDIPGISSSGKLTEGKHKGTTDLVLNIKDQAMTETTISLDNTGSRSIGSERASADLKIKSPFKKGEIFSFGMIHSQHEADFNKDGSDYISAAVNLPVSANGWTLGASASHFKYNLISSDFYSLDAHGKSNTIGVDSSYPIIRSPMKNLFFKVNVDHKTFYNKASSSVTSRYYSDALTLSLNANLLDRIGAGGSNAGYIKFTQGDLNLNGSPNQSSDSSGAKTAGSFNKLTYGTSRTQTINDKFSIYGALSGQYGFKNLDSSEQFSLGGASGVRAYPISEGSGASGNIINLELRYKIKPDILVTSFVDYGVIRVNYNNNFPGSIAPNNYSLKGAGLSVLWHTPIGSVVKLTWSHRIDKNPNPSSNGNDQDGSLVKNRFWISTSYNF